MRSAGGAWRAINGCASRTMTSAPLQESFGMSSIEGKNISKAFGGVQALKAASFSAEPGEVHALVGENGAGKSTMIKILSGLLRPDAGRVRVHGKDVVLESPQAALRLGIGTIFQELTLLPYMTVA